MKQKLILSLLIMTFGVLSIAGVLATSNVQGDISLTWTNAYDRTQLFSGPVTGPLAGTITMTGFSDYAKDNGESSVMWSDNVVLTTSDAICNGFYTASEVMAMQSINPTTNDTTRIVGTFTLHCDDGNIIQGMMRGYNSPDGKVKNLKYSALVIAPVRGPKGDQGEQGLQGLPGIDGTNGIDGKDGADGKDGLNGLDGKDGINGVNGLDGKDGADGKDGTNGVDGLPGAKGDTGAQGIQGIAGPVGPTGPQGPIGNTGSCTCSIATNFTNLQNGLFTFFPDFKNWFNAGPDVCINGQLRCLSTAAQKCVNYAWVTQSTCQYGCTSGVCNPAPLPKCKTGYNFIATQTYCTYMDGEYRPGNRINVCSNRITQYTSGVRCMTPNN